MSTKRETILSAVESVLAGTSGVSTRIYRSRVQAFARAEHPSLVIEPISDSADPEAVHRLLWTMIFAVIVVVRADDIDGAYDPIVSDVHSKIMGSATIDAMLVEINPVSTDWQFVDADKPLGVITLQYKAVYQTARNSLSVI